MSNIVQLKPNDTYELELVKRSLIGLRSCYPKFEEWFNEKVYPNISKSRQVFLATHNGIFSGALILKNTSNEKKVCTLFVNENNRFNKLGTDLIRIASEELETYKLPITISSEVHDVFSNAESFNFYQTDKRKNMYIEGVDEYLGYILFHNPDRTLHRKIL